MRRISLTDKTDVGTICIVLNTNAPNLNILILYVQHQKIGLARITMM